MVVSTHPVNPMCQPRDRYVHTLHTYIHQPVSAVSLVSASVLSCLLEHFLQFFIFGTSWNSPFPAIPCPSSPAPHFLLSPRVLSSHAPLMFSRLMSLVFSRLLSLVSSRLLSPCVSVPVFGILVPPVPASRGPAPLGWSCRRTSDRMSPDWPPN